MLIQNINSDWRFYLEKPDEPPFKLISGKNQEATGYAARHFNAGAWRNVDLPHDWGMELDYEPDADFNHGHYPTSDINRDGVDPARPFTRRARSIGWYRRELFIPANWENKCVYLRFDGVFRDCRVYVNGHFMARHESGYSPLRVEIGDELYYGESNSIAVRVDASQFEGWWYEGAGIYRGVYLECAEQVHIVPDGTHIIASTDGHMRIEFACENSGDQPCDIGVTAGLRESVSPRSAVLSLSIPAYSSKCGVIELDEPVPRLWDIDSPNLYTLELELSCSGHATDSQTTRFGFRDAIFDPERGFMLNGRSVKINGACVHQDFAGLGVALPRDVQFFKIARLKQFGFNAYRASHNMPSREIVEACDELGMLLMDETRLFSTSPDAIGDLEALVKRDRNSPSVIMWSTGNEEHSVQNSKLGTRILTRLMRAVKALDDTRPVTYSGNNGGQYDGANSASELRGINYIHISKNSFADEYHAAHPQQPMFGSEEGSYVTTRGEYNHTESHVSSYGDGVMPWGSTAEGWVKFYAARPFLCGGFLWTGFDYFGEPTPHFANVCSNFGAIDNCGFAKDTAYYYRSCWTSEPMLHLLPNWDDAYGAARRGSGHKLGENVRVVAYTNCDSVELFLNGHSLGVKQPQPLSPLEWFVNYEPGVLEARGSKAGVEIIARRATSSKPSQLALSCLNSESGNQTALVAVELRDADGNFCATACDMLCADILPDEGGKCGEIIGCGNGDPASRERNKYLAEVACERVLDWQVEYGMHAMPWNAFQASDGGQYFWNQPGMPAVQAEVRPPFMDTKRTQMLYFNSDTASARFSTEFIARENYTRIVFNRIVGRYSVILDGVLLGEGDNHGYACGFDAEIVPGAHRLEVTCADVLLPWRSQIPGGIFDGVYLQRDDAPVWRRSAFNGRALFIVRRGAGETIIRVQGNGIAPQTLRL